MSSKYKRGKDGRWRNKRGRFVSHYAVAREKVARGHKPKPRKVRAGKLDPDRLLRELVESLEPELSSRPRGAVREVITKWGEVWHHFDITWKQYVDIEEAAPLFQVARGILRPFYRRATIIIVNAIKLDHMGNVVVALGWKNVSEMNDFDVAFSQVPGNLLALHKPGNNDSFTDGIIGIGVHVEAPKDYARAVGKERKFIPHSPGERQEDRKNVKRNLKRKSTRVELRPKETARVDIRKIRNSKPSRRKKKR